MTLFSTNFQQILLWNLQVYKIIHQLTDKTNGTANVTFLAEVIMKHVIAALYNGEKRNSQGLWWVLWLLNDMLTQHTLHWFPPSVWFNHIKANCQLCFGEKVCGDEQHQNRVTCPVPGSETQAWPPQRDSDLNIYWAPMPLPFDP